MKPRRLGVYLVYDRQNIVDEYIGYFLKELRGCVSTLVVVCNMEHIARGEEILRKYADQIFFHGNVGFDAGGFKDALCSLIGWETVLGYDELVLANDSMFGPFRPMQEIFDEMDMRKTDFWGLTKNGPYQKAGIDEYPEHIQTFFLVIRSKLLHSGHFRDYWESMGYFQSFNQTIREYELRFTPHFAHLGYTYDVLADIDANNSENLENNYGQYAKIPYELMQKRNFPFFKKKPLSDEFDLLEEQTQESMRQAIDYIDHHTNYDINLIWDNVIRTLNVADLQRTLHFQYIISPSSAGLNGSTVVVVFVSHESSAEYVLEYLRMLPERCSIRVAAHSAKLLEPYQESGYCCQTVVPRQMNHYLAEFCTYDYVCVLHDTDLTSQNRRSCTGKSAFYGVWENLLKNGGHISGIEECFTKEPRLGFLAPPQLNFAEHFAEIGTGWNGMCKGARNIAERLGLNCQISENKVPFRVTNDFWMRGHILSRLKDMTEDELQYLPYLWSYLAQDAGCYSGVVESTDYASMNEVNLKYYLDQIATGVRNQYGSFEYFFELQKRILEPALLDFCKKYERIYIYGTGLTARRYRDLFPKIDAFVISDGQVKLEELYGTPVRYLSEIKLSDDCGIVLCLFKANQAQVMEQLKKCGFQNYFCVQYGGI